MGILPAPDNDVSGIDDHPWRVEMIGMDIVNLDWAGRGGFSDHGHWNILPDGFLLRQPDISTSNEYEK